MAFSYKVQFWSIRHRANRRKAYQVPTQFRGRTGDHHPGSREDGERPPEPASFPPRALQLGLQQVSLGRGTAAGVAQCARLAGPKLSADLPVRRPQMLRKAPLNALGKKLDGNSAAAKPALRKRACLSDVLGMVAESKYFTSAANPLQSVQRTAPRTAEEIDPKPLPTPPGTPSLRRRARPRQARRTPGSLLRLPLLRMHAPSRGDTSTEITMPASRVGLGNPGPTRRHSARHVRLRPARRLFRTTRGGPVQEQRLRRGVVQGPHRRAIPR